MGSLKTLAFAGAVAMVAVSAVTASAADLAPAPAPLMAPPPAPMIETSSGIYLRGDVGVGHMGETTVSSVLTNTALPPVPDWRRDSTSLGNVGFAGVGVGYQFNSFLRADITAEFRTSSQYNGLFSYQDAVTCATTPGNRCYDRYRSSIQSNVFLANTYIDLGTWRGITPFVGAGVGLASHKIHGIMDEGWPNIGLGIGRDKTSTKLAWALMAGLGFEVTRNLKMEVGYRYLNMGTATSGVIVCQNTVNPCYNETQKFKLQSHDVKVGFRYLLADDAPVAAAPVMYAAPAVAPVIRKY
jgi:opacity protein-like surface antigen